MRFLVPVDGSPNAERAVQQLIRELKRGGAADVHLLHVQPTEIASDIPLVGATESIDRVREAEAVQATLRAADLLTEAGIQYMTHVEIGDPGETIASYASGHGCDEIVMGTRGMGTVIDRLFGSVAAKVVQLASMPVMLVK